MARTYELIEYNGDDIRRSLLEVGSYEEAVAVLEAAGATRTGAMGTLPDNTGELGPFFWARGTVNKGRPIILPAWGKEVEAPWRRGFGIALRFGAWSRVLGVWWRGAAPVMPEIEDLVDSPFVSPRDLL